MTTGPSGYDIAALIIAGIAGAMALASVVWNIAEFRLSGARIKVNLLFGAVGPSGLVSFPSIPRDWQLLVSQGFTEPLVGINVVNKGRASTVVEHFRCRLSNGFALADAQLQFNPDLRFVLEPHRSETWRLQTRDVMALAKASRSIGHSASTAPSSPPPGSPPTNGMAVAALVLGIVGVVLGLVPLTGFIALICGILGLIFGFAGYGRAKKGAPHKTMAIWGIVLGGAALVLGIIGLTIVADVVEDLDRQLNS